MEPIIVATRNTSGIPEFAGSTWVRLQYLLGLRQMGLDAYWVDRLGPVDPCESRRTVEYLADRFARTLDAFGLQDRFCIVYDDGAQHFGLSGEDLLKVCKDASLLICVSESPPPESPLGRIPRRAYVDVDPGFTQIWAQQVDMGLEFHNLFFTIGQNVGLPSFPIDCGGIEWHRILPPVVLEEWPDMSALRCDRFTTVADWRGSQVAEHAGVSYVGKRTQFLEVIDLPRRAEGEFELALCIGQWDHPDIGQLSDCGWRLVDPYRYAGEPQSYRQYIQHSASEFSVAKGGYVRSNSGWISDRTACYLASGKPALVQSTGFEESLPTGEGLLTFGNLDEAVAGATEIREAYSAHATAARELAKEYFDAKKVLGEILDIAGL